MPEKTFFITTPIYYINGTPSVGHAYTQIAADARARFERSRGRKVYFLTGTDENALKVSRVAQERGQDTQTYADEMAQAFRDVWDALNISYDDYIRTTEPRHKIVVQRVVEKLWQSGCVTLGTYSGWYSVPDETFFREEETVAREGQHYLANPSEDQTKEPLEWVEETVHFFKLSQFEDALLEYYNTHPETLQPETRRNETLSFIRSGLRDTSISRVQDWGIPVPHSVPHHEGHVVYVWFPDALLNYASAPGFLSDDPAQAEFFESVWPPDVQLMSKDIFTRFHSTLWPALLQALGLPLPKLLFAHGFWTFNGRKMSKRDPETIVEPVSFALQIAERATCDFETAVDALRFYCLREFTFGADGDFSREGCLARYNSDLANSLGNLVNRALSMLQQWDFNGIVPEANGELGLRNAIENAHSQVEKAYEELDFSAALSAVFDVVSQGNRTIEEQKPWQKIKDGEREAVAVLLCELLLVCQWCAVALAPVMPHAAHKLLQLLRVGDAPQWKDALSAEFIVAGHECSAPEPLFPRIPEILLTFQLVTAQKEKGKPMSDSSPDNAENAVVAAITEVRADTPVVPDAAEPAEVSSADAPMQSSDEAHSPVIEYSDFARVELRAAKILEAERIPKADKLLRLQVDLGTERRQILAGIAQQFEPESLIGKTVVVVANLAPRKMRGLESQGMLLAASADADGPPSGLITVDADVPPGSIIR